MPSSLPALPLESCNKQDYNEQNVVPIKDNLKNW
jgi:hypothetical protein